MACCWTLLYCASALAVACYIDKRVQYYMKFIAYLAYTLISTMIFVPIMIVRGRSSKNGLLPGWAVRTCTKWLLGITWEIRGLENNLPEGQGCVVTMNHQSALDVVFMTYIWRYVPNGHTIAKREVFWIYPFPWYWNTVFIDKLNPEKAQNDINTTGKLITSNYARICMFPEGTRHMGESLLPFKKGAFHIALAAQCPIQPVVCSKYHFLDYKNRRLDQGRAIIEFLKPIPTKGMTKEQLPELMDKVRDAMQEAYTRLSVEAEALNPHLKKIN